MKPCIWNDAPLPEGCSYETQPAYDGARMCGFIEHNGAAFEIDHDENGTVFLEYVSSGWGGSGPTLEDALSMAKRRAYEFYTAYKALANSDSYREIIKNLAEEYERDCDE